jgi:hypothetical protein
MYKIKTLFTFGLSMLFFTSCIDDIDLKPNAATEFLVVDGILSYSETADSNELVVKMGISRSDLIRPIPFSGAIAEIVVNDKDSYPLPEREAGSYYLFRKDVLKVGQSYKLRFKAKGYQYESNNEILPDSVTIKKAYFETNLKGTAETAYQLFVDVDDIPQKKNFYRWSFVQWEKQGYCQFCYAVAPNRPISSCREDIYAIPNEYIASNYFCDGNCYDMLSFLPNNVTSDVFSDGKPLIRKSIGYAPFVFLGGCLVEIRQSSISIEYYLFLELLKSQADNTGTFSDTPAALLVGNIKNLDNPNEKVVGYFSVTNTTKKRIWLNRKDGLFSGFNPLSNRNPPVDPIKPFFIPCKISKTRTNIKPVGWQ